MLPRARVALMASQWGRPALGGQKQLSEACKALPQLGLIAVLELFEAARSGNFALGVWRYCLKPHPLCGGSGDG